MARFKTTKRIFIALTALFAVAATAVAVDYNHGEAQKTEASWTTRKKCFISLSSRSSTLKAIATNYLVTMSTLAGRDITKDAVEPVVKSKFKARWAFDYGQWRAYRLERCFDFPVSGRVVQWAQSYKFGQPATPAQ